MALCLHSKPLLKMRFLCTSSIYIVMDATRSLLSLKFALPKSSGIGKTVLGLKCVISVCPPEKDSEVDICLCLFLQLSAKRI